jgi:hypothetical protein
VAILLVGLQVFFAAAFVPAGGSVRLQSTEFRWFSSDPPAPITAGPTSWALPVPAHPGEAGKLAVNDAVSVDAFDLGELSFTATFVNGTFLQGHPSEFADELVVFAASDVTSYQGFEFGIRLSLADGFVYAYWQHPAADGGVAFHEQRLFANDGRAHAYELSLSGTAVSYVLDGYPVYQAIYPLVPPRAFHVVTTAHRQSGGWSATGLELSVSDVTVRQPLL